MSYGLIAMMVLWTFGLGMIRSHQGVPFLVFLIEGFQIGWGLGFGAFWDNPWTLLGHWAVYAIGRIIFLNAVEMWHDLREGRQIDKSSMTAVQIVYVAIEISVLVIIIHLT